MENSQKTYENLKIPEYVSRITETLEKAGFQAFLVGGCVRDLIINREPKDWDITTDAIPEEIMPLFEKTVYENKFGTVAVIFPEVSQETSENVPRETNLPLPRGSAQGARGSESDPSSVLPLAGEEKIIVEITPFRTESTYSDSRHPNEVKFSKNLRDDLKRRDFTINAMAMKIERSQNGCKGHLTDIYGGLKDIKDKVIRTVGEPADRLAEDALRMMRAIRFSVQLGFAISSETIDSIVKNVLFIEKISYERTRDEFIKIIMSPQPSVGIELLQKTNLLKRIIPELEEGIGCEQMGEHIYDVYQHLLHALNHAGEKNWPLEIRIAALFHDIGKPRTRRWDGTKAGGKGKYTFYGHEVIGARMAKVILQRMKFPKDSSELIIKLVRYHMFFSDTEAITLSAVRRTIVNIGRDHIWELMQIRECDRVGMKKKEAPYRLRKYHAMIEETLRAPTSVGMLKVDGTFLMKDTQIKPGPRMGWILHALLEEVLENPEKNIVEYLKNKILELNMLSDKELRDIGKKGKETKEQLEEEEIKKLHKKHAVYREAPTRGRSNRV